jgi:RNA polymerase sigma factor (TIGR02999 family)
VDTSTSEGVMASRNGQRAQAGNGRIEGLSDQLMRPEPRAVTDLLTRWRGGDAAALDELMPIVYAELREIAERALRGERAGHTLQPTALVHEAFLRLVRTPHVDWRGRAHFLGAMAGTVRRVLVDYARRTRADKRPSAGDRVDADEAFFVTIDRPRPITALDDALTSFARIDPRRARVVELKFFGGLAIAEIADLAGVSPGTVKRDLAIARAWLARELGTGLE